MATESGIEALCVELDRLALYGVQDRDELSNDDDLDDSQLRRRSSIVCILSCLLSPKANTKVLLEINEDGFHSYITQLNNIGPCLSK